MDSQDTIKIEVAYALPHKQFIIALEVAATATALEAAKQSGICAQFEEIDLENARLGLFGKAVAPSQVLRKARAARVKARRAQEKPS